MELRHFRYFLALAEKQSFSRAAAALRIAQPTLSQQIRQLELTLGTALVHRERRPVELTEAGRTFLPFARNALAAIDAGKRALAAPAEQLAGELRIGVTQGPMRSLADLSALRYARRSGDIRLRVLGMSAGDVKAGVASGDLHLGLCCDIEPGPNYELIPVFKDRALVAVHPEHSFATHKFVRMAWLDGVRMVLPPSGMLMGRLFERCLLEGGTKPVIVMETDSFTVMQNMLEDNRVVGLASESTSHMFSKFVTLPLEGPRINFTLFVVVPDGDKDPLLPAFISDLRGVLSQMVASADEIPDNSETGR